MVGGCLLGELFLEGGSANFWLVEMSPPALQIRAITINLWPLTTHIYHAMIIMTSGFSKKSLLLFPRNSFEHVFLEFKHLYKTHRISLFSFYLIIFIRCFVIFLCSNALHLFILFHCMQTHWMSLFSFCLLFCNHSVYYRFPPSVNFVSQLGSK